MMTCLTMSEDAEEINPGKTNVGDLDLKCTHHVTDSLPRTMAGFWGCVELRQQTNWCSVSNSS